jgi:hypothetical protein
VTTKKKTSKKTPGSGRKPFPYDPKKLKAIAMVQATDSEIASMLGVTPAAVSLRRKSDKTFDKIIEEGRESGRLSVRRRMFVKAVEEGDMAAIKFFHNHYMSMPDFSNLDVNIKMTYADLIKEAHEFASPAKKKK